MGGGGEKHREHGVRQRERERERERERDERAHGDRAGDVGGGVGYAADEVGVDGEVLRRRE